MRLSESQLLFLARFAKAPEGREFLELLRAKVGHCDAKLRTETGKLLYRTQGRALELDDLIADITEAHKRLATNASAAQRPRKFVLTDGSAA